MGKWLAQRASQIIHHSEDIRPAQSGGNRPPKSIDCASDGQRDAMLKCQRLFGRDRVKKSVSALCITPKRRAGRMRPARALLWLTETPFSKLDQNRQGLPATDLEAIGHRGPPMNWRDLAPCVMQMFQKGDGKNGRSRRDLRGFHRL